MLRRWRIRILIFLAVLGPGFITANVDNDAGGILTYSQAGAQYGYSLLWTMLPMTLALIVVQEMCARLGVVTGKGLSDLIREEFGLRATFFVMILLVIVNFTNVIAEFSGIAGSLGLFHISRYIAVPVCAVLVWFLVVKGDYKSVEKVFLGASVFYVAYIVAGFLAGPNWHDALLATIEVPSRSEWNNKDYVYMTFYMQASVVEKGVSVKKYALTRLDVIVGSVFTDIVAWFIVVACAATLFANGLGSINVAADAAEAMKPLAGKYAYLLFAIGLFNASLFAASILPLSTAYTVCEGLGLEAGVDKSFHEAPAFYWLYTLLIAGGAAVVLLPNFPIVKMTILSQFLNGLLVPVIIIFMLKLINRKDLMGKYRNSLVFNSVAWLTVAVITILFLVWVYMTWFA
jgi:Mn2+/Fe2+ NRAMP family transporter